MAKARDFLVEIGTEELPPKSLLVTYLRIKGLVPPSSEGRPRQPRRVPLVALGRRR